MKMNVRGNDGFETPDFLYRQLDRVFNFTLDAACTTANCKAPRGLYFDQGIDALQTSWGGERVFCNPPFSQKAAFIAKAYDEVINGDCVVVVMVLPSNCTDCRAFHQYIYKKFFYEILSGRVSFMDPATGRAAKGNNSGTIIIYFKKDITTRE